MYQRETACENFEILQRNLGSEIYFLEERIMKMTDVERIENDFCLFMTFG